MPQAGLRQGLGGGPAYLPLKVAGVSRYSELSRMGLELGLPMCDLGLINFQEQDRMCPLVPGSSVCCLN